MRLQELVRRLENLKTRLGLQSIDMFNHRDDREELKQDVRTLEEALKVLSMLPGPSVSLPPEPLRPTLPLISIPDAPTGPASPNRGQRPSSPVRIDCSQSPLATSVHYGGPPVV